MKLPPTLIKVLKKLQYTGVPITQRESCKIRYLLYKRNIVNKAFDILLFLNASDRCQMRYKHRVNVININLKLTLSIILKFKES